MNIGSLRRVVLGFGLIGSFAFVLGGVWIVFSRVWALSFTQMLEVLVVTPFLAAWVLGPVVWIARPRGSAAGSDEDNVVSFVTTTSLVAVAAFAYTYEFVLLPLVFDVPPSLSSLVVVLTVPALQWLVLGAGTAVGRVRGSPSEDGR